MMTNDARLRALPAVDRLLNDADHLIAEYGRDAVLSAARESLDHARQRILKGDDVPVAVDALLLAMQNHLADAFQPTLRPVINATGVIVHTNLGRAPLSEAARQAVEAIAAGYSTLEYDPDTGTRGSRLIHAEALLTEITGAEAALVVNNNAAATVLLLAELAAGREVIVSRGQLVEIGGGFRVPEIMAQSGARLVEVGTTNRTRPADYERAITEETALLMRVHSSNFKQVGFVEEAPLDALADIAGRHGLMLVDDLGSGALIDTAPFGLAHEPTVHESIAAGCDVVAFSGDKLLGGPQAGILAGKRAVIDRLKRHPLARAMRADKLCLAALAATLDHYRRDEALTHIPVLRMIARPLTDIRAMAVRWMDELASAGVIADVIDGESTVGGGSLPGAVLPTALLAIRPESAEAFARDLRGLETPVITRIADGRVLFDPRTVLPEQETLLLSAISGLAKGV